MTQEARGGHHPRPLSPREMRVLVVAVLACARRVAGDGCAELRDELSAQLQRHHALEREAIELRKPRPRPRDDAHRRGAAQLERELQRQDPYNYFYLEVEATRVR